jgi:DNA-binding Lrp family transcriptional regulator
MSSFEMRRKARGFVLLDVKPGMEREIAEKLMEFSEVKETHVIPGQHDLLVVLEIERELITPPSEKIMNFVTELSDKIEGIQNTVTIVPTVSLTKFRESA